MSININNDKSTCRSVSDDERGQKSEKHTLRQRVLTPALVVVVATSIRRVASGECGGVGGNAVVGEFFESTP